MGTEIEPMGHGEIEPGPSAQGVVSAVVVTCEATGVIVPSSWRGIIGRNAKTLLTDGFPFDMVVAACYMAVLRGHPEFAQYIAGDLMLATQGQRMSRAEYEQKLQLYAADKKGGLLDEQRSRRADTERKRNGH